MPPGPPPTFNPRPAFLPKPAPAPIDADADADPTAPAPKRPRRSLSPMTAPPRPPAAFRPVRPSPPSTAPRPAPRFQPLAPPSASPAPAPPRFQPVVAPTAAPRLLADAFSPRRRAERFVPGGMAGRVRGWVVAASSGEDCGGVERAEEVRQVGEGCVVRGESGGVVVVGGEVEVGELMAGGWGWEVQGVRVRVGWEKGRGRGEEMQGG